MNAYNLLVGLLYICVQLLSSALIPKVEILHYTIYVGGEVVNTVAFFYDFCRFETFTQCLNRQTLAGGDDTTGLEGPKHESRRDEAGRFLLDRAISHQLWGLGSAVISSPTGVPGIVNSDVF